MKKSLKIIHNKAYEISYNILKTNWIDTMGIIAGKHHFTDLWARDSLFATFGSTVCGLESAIKQTVETFFTSQKSDGLIPYRILQSPTTIGKYFGHPSYYKTPKPDFRSHQSGGLVLDGGLMTIIACKEYVEKINDMQFLHKYYSHLQKSLEWYIKRFGNKLLSEWFQCEWMDAVLKSGKVLYTNVLYLKAIDGMKFLSEKMNDKVNFKKYNSFYTHIFSLFNKTFWTGEYFADWVDYKRQDYFNTGANLMTVWFDIADKEQSKRILSYSKLHCIQTFTLETNYPKYPWWRIPFQNYIVGLGDYWNGGCLWLQNGLLYALAQYSCGNFEEAKRMLYQIALKIIEFDDTFEVYEKNGKPVKRLFYTSEKSFAWTAGLYLYAYHILFQ
jgi:glycogen debranching enzyme